MVTRICTTYPCITSIYIVLAELLLLFWRQTTSCRQTFDWSVQNKPLFTLDDKMCGLPPAECKKLS